MQLKMVCDCSNTDQNKQMVFPKKTDEMKTISKLMANYHPVLNLDKCIHLHAILVDSVSDID